MIKLRSWWRHARESFWFMPALIVVGCVLMAFALVEIDVRIDGDWMNQMPLLFGAGAEGSRGLLGVVASSMITVAGVVFSITIVALSLTSSQYSSRVLRNFMGDRPNQFVLGSFVGIFAYCLVVLRTIRGGDEGAFVPSLAVLMGLVLGLAGVAVLIFFIHHIAVSIQALQILAKISDETLEAVDRLFPQELGDEEVPPREPEEAGRSWHVLAAHRTGYLQAVDSAKLLERARERDAVARMECGIGEFVIDGAPLLSVLVADKLTDEQAADFRSLFSVDRQRTLEQDAAFGIRQIVDVALKALSPGINDTTTAVACVEYLTAILARLSDRRIESRFRSDDGQLRVIAKGPTFASLTSEAYDQIRQFAEGNVAVLRALLWSLETLARINESVSRRSTLLDQARAITETVDRSVSATLDREALASRANDLIKCLT